MNPFDQFDAEASGASAEANPFDQFDSTSKQNKKQNKGILADLATDVKRGVEQLPGAVTGLADVVNPLTYVTGRALVSEGADALGNATGFKPSKWAKDAEAEYSPARQEARKAVDQAWETGDAGEIAKSYIQNPSHLVGTVAESIPSMVAGGLAGRAALGIGARGVSKAAGGIGPELPGVIARTVGEKLAPAVGAGIGEGAVMAGQDMNQMVDDGVDPRTAGATAAAIGVAGGAIGAMGGKIAQRMGVVDPEMAIAGGATRATQEASNGTMGAVKNAAKRIGGGFVSEGMLEELPQSALEQALQNLAGGKPWDEGLARASVEGGLAGGIMGAGANILPGKPDGNSVDTHAITQPPQSEKTPYTLVTDPEPIQKRLDALFGINQQRLNGDARANYEKAVENAFNEQVGYVVGEDGLEQPFTMGDYLKSQVRSADITRDRPKAEAANASAAARMDALAGEEATVQPDIRPSEIAARPAIPVVGTLSAVANMAVQSGAHAETVAQQAAAQAAENTSPEGEGGTPATAPQAGPAAASPAENQFDVSSHTDNQLSYLALRGQPGFKEAAIAELQKRGIEVQQQPPAEKKQSKPLAQWTAEEIQARLDRGNLTAESEKKLRDLLATKQPKKAESKKAGENITVGMAPGNAQPVTVRNGVIHIGDEPAVNYETGEDVKIAENSTPQQIVDALKESGALGRRKVFGVTPMPQSAKLKPEAAPGQSAQQQTQGADHGQGQTETEVLNKPGAENDSAPTVEPDPNSPVERARAVYGRLKQEGPSDKNKSQQLWVDQVSEQLINPNRYHPVVEDDNQKGLKIGDAVTLKDGSQGIVVSVQKAKGTGRQSGYEVKVASRDNFGGWHDLGNVTKVGNVTPTNEGDGKQTAEKKAKSPAKQEAPTFWTSSTPAHRKWIMDASGLKQYTALTPWNRIKPEHQAALIEKWGDKPADQNPIKNETPSAATDSNKETESTQAQIKKDENGLGKSWDAMDYGQRQAIAEKSTIGGMRRVVHRISGSKWSELGESERKSMIAAYAASESKQEQAPAINQKEVAKSRKVFERELHVSVLADAGLNELAGTAELDAYTTAAEKLVVDTVSALKKEAATPEAKAALDALVQDGKPVLPKTFFEAAYKSAKKAWENQQKENARDPEQYKETLQWGMGAANIEADSSDAEKYKAGFDHALRGQTKSTLPNDSDVYLKGYNDARAWIKTEEGRAWFDGKRIEKQKNTGVVLKRWWERVKKDIAGLTDTSDKAWESMLKSTARSDLFPMTVIDDDATPGAKEIMEKLRANVSTFQEFFWWEGAGQIGWKTGRYGYGPKELFSGRYSGYRGRITGNVQDDDALRLSVSKDIAGEYQEKLKAFAEAFAGVKTLDDIQKVADELFFPDGRLDDNGKLKDWKKSDYYNQNGALFAPNAGKIKEILPLFESDAWDAKYASWTKAKNSEAIERQGRGDRKESLIRPRLDRIVRSGLPNERGQRNISSAEFKKTFGFADVVIGQYVTAQQAQDHLNYAYDALMTMAGLLNAKPKQLSFGGKLYFTIGALGHGKYAAHFQMAHPVEIDGKETHVPVINVTATRGDGSVLHEFFHAIDFLTTDPALKKAISSIKKLLVKEPGDPEGVLSIAEQFLSGSRYMTWGGRKDRGSPKDQALYALNNYFGNDSKRTNTSFYSEALALDKGSTKPYWSNDAEPFARMAEAWGFDTLSNSDKRDDYLVSDWAKDGKVKRPSYRGAPYPMAKERERLVALFNRMVGEIQWTDNGPVLKSESPWQQVDPWKEVNQPYLDALKNVADNINAVDAQRKEKEAQKKIDAEKARMAAIFGEEKKEEVAPPAATEAPEADNVGMSEDELSAIFDEEASALREETQEQPKAEEPGEKITTPKDRWTQEDLQFVLQELEEGRMILVAGDDLGIPTIHDMPNGRHMGMGVFSASGLGWEASFTGGGEMYSTPGGISYTVLSPRYPTKIPQSVYDIEAVKGKIKGKMLARSGPRAAPKLSDEQAKTAGELAKEMAKHGVTGIDEALKGLVSIFGGGKGKLMSFPGGFDEESYNAAKPHFLAAAEAFGKAGLAFKDFVRVFFRSLIQQFGDGVKPYAIRFAKDYESEFLAKQQPTKEQESEEPKSEYVTDSASRKLADWVKAQIDDGERFDWRTLFAKADEFFGGTQANGVYSPKDAYDAMELGINLYLLDAKQAYPLENDTARARRVIEKLDTDILALVATQTKRTAEQDEFQQFSTPPTYAYLANWVANLNANDSYLEPSAGIGGMALFGKNAGVREVVVNELSSRRLGVLQNMPFDRYFSENAEQLNNILPAEIQPTVIVMNPPFSSTAGRAQGQRDMMNGARHIEQALKRLNSGGRLVAIVGEGMAADRPAFRDWWRKIMAEYNVRANLGIEGTGYVKYGTTFDNQILVIDKTGPTSDAVVTGKVKSPADALNLLENVRATRPVAAQNQAANRLDQQPAGQPGGRGTAENGPITAPGNDAGPAGPSGMGSDGGAESGRGRGGRGGDAANNDAAGNERPLGGRRGQSAESGRPDRGNAARTDGAGNAAGRSGSNEPAVDAVKVGSAENAEASGEIGNSVFEQYSPKKVRIDGAVPHNTPLVESAALASVVPPDPTYAPKLGKDIIKKGLLSDAQLEAVVYAGQAHQQMLPDGKTRRGFFLGDGTGVGKGRQISGVILDNWNQGRKKAIWISKKKELIVDAKRDFGDLGGDAGLLIDLGKKKIGEAIGAEHGVLFAGYPTIRGQTKAARDAVKANKGARKQNDDGISYERIQQIVDWVGKDFDGALVFDEAHEMGNAVPIKGKRGNKKPSDQALAALELQRALPLARVMYVSATGATEVSNLAYAERLGIWGDGTPFSTVLNFVAEMSRSVSAMELVAQNLKQMGLYLARSLSYDGVQYERLEHTLTGYQRETYDKLAESWQVVLQNINDALETTGVMPGGKSAGKESGKIKSNIMSAFWGAHQRFFNQIITASQMPSVIKQMEEDIAAGKSIVLQITNTNEADQSRALAKLAGQQVSEDEDADSLEELDLTPRDQLIQLVTRAFPVAQYESYTDEDGKEGIRLAKDSKGNPVINQEAVAKRDALIEELKHYEVPDSPLQMIIDVFGAEAVAEITGRTQRVVMSQDGKRKVEKRSSAAVFADAESFKNDKKKILIFSQAGGTGFSFHADRRYKNKSQRVHYVLQPGWSADKAVQGFGRSHRTNQVSAPIYRLITTDIPAQKRFISSIARRLEQLGALTAGQRDTAGGSMFSAMDNLESKYATMAVRQFFEALKPGTGIADMPADLLEQMGLSGLYDDNGALVESKIPPVTQFLNRLLSLKLDAQQAAFDFFMKNMEAQIDLAKRIGSFDDGMQTIRHKGAAAQNEQVVYTDPMTGAPTKYYEIQYKVENPIYSFKTANSTITASKQGGWFKNNHSGRVAGVWTTNQVRTDKEGRIHKLYGIWRTSGTTYENADDFKPAAWTKLTEADAKAVWEAENAERPTTVPRRLHMVVGGILPIWDRFNNENVSVVRLSLDDGRRLLGRQVMDKDVADTMNRLNVQSAAAKMTGAELIKAVIGGATVEMSNRIRFKLATVSGQKRVELDRGNRWFDFKDEKNLRDAGVINERIEYKQRYFIPADPKIGGAALDEIMRVMAMNPVSVTNEDEAQDGAGNVADSSSMSPADKAIYGMAAEGKSAAEILKFIADTSRNPFYRQLAKLLQKTGIAPRMTVGTAKGWQFNAGNDKKYAAAYSPKTNTVALFRPAAAERNMLHELMHAATLKALEKNGMASAQMKRLFDHVKNTGKLAGKYGMSDVDEFVAEAFSNPKFQAVLKTIAAPQASGTLSNAWHWFVRVVRGILGLPSNQESALSQALEIGVGVMREDMAIRRGSEGKSIPFAEVTGREIDGMLGRNAQEKATNWMRSNLQGKSFKNDATGWDISVGRKGINKAMSHGGKETHARSVAAIPDLLKNAVLVSSENNKNAADRMDVSAVHHFYAPFVMGGQQYIARMVVKETRAGEKFYDYDTSDEVSPTKPNADAHLPKEGAAAGTAGRSMSMSELLSYVKAEHGGTNPRFNLIAGRGSDNVFRMADKDTVAGTQAPTSAGDGSRVVATEKLRREMAEYESRLFGGSYSDNRLRTSPKDAPIRRMIMQARERYNGLREQAGLQAVFNWSVMPNEPSASEGSDADGIRYNIADEGWSVSEPSKLDDVIYALQDKHIDTKRVVQAIIGAGRNIHDQFNPYLQEELFHGRSAKGVKDFLDFELRPLLKQMQDAKVDMGDFEEYLWNRHAEERNKQIAKINPDMPDGGSGIKTADARAYLAKLGAEQRRVFESMATKVEAINRNSQRILVESGLEKQSTIDAWNNAYQHYVPLQREDVDSGHVGTGKGFSVRGSSSKRAMGSGRKVVDILANITMQRERNIVRAEKNRVSNALAGLVAENPNANFWTLDKAPKERVVQETAIYTVVDAQGAKVDEFTNMADADKLARTIPGGDIEQTWGDRVNERVVPGFKSRDNVLLTRINGEDHYIVFNERDERAMRMAMAMKNLDVDNLGRVLSVMGKATRYLASVNTQYNPVFGVINLIRDAQGALLNLSSTPLAGEQKRVLGYTVDALRGIYAYIRAHRKGQTPSSNWAKLFEEFQKEGGQTGYRDQYANAEQRAEAVRDELAQFKEGKAKQLTRGVFGWLSDYNETMENAVRLATYKAAKERGLSNQRAASLAKNITVNFNRKGQMATQVGALYAFFNASVQGTARMAETLFDSNNGNLKGAKLSKAGKKIVYGGILLGSMQALLLAAAGFDDDEPPEFVRERNLILPVGDGKYLTLAMPLGFHVLPGVGRIATEFAMGGMKNPLKHIAALGNMLAETFNPVGNAGFSLQTLTPSVIDPLAALAENKDFTGKPIYKESFNAMNPTPGHTRAKDTATVWSKAISESLNFITGGTEYKPGMFSPTPDQIDYLIGQATGGVGRELGKVAQVGESSMTGEELPLYKVPLVGRFVGDTKGQAGESSKFYENVKQINAHELQYKGLIGDGRRAEAAEYLADNPAVRLIMAGNHAERAVQKLRAQKRDLIEQDANRSAIVAVDGQITAVMRQFNERANPLMQ